jgi:hypothetical protein
VPVQDPDQLRRLRLLYQYGAQQITALEVLCHYPIPEIPDKPETTADAKAKDKPDDADKDKNQKPKKVYIRGERPYSCVDIATRPSALVKRMLIGPNPDPAFLKPPGCVLCAYPNKTFNARFLAHDKIYESTTSEDTVEVDPTKYEYVPVVLNDWLIPTGQRYDYSHREGHINWLSVVKDDEGPPTKESIRVGSSHGYTVYTTNEKNFSEFVLAITEATLQSPELQKTAAPPPPTVQTNPR